MPPPPASAAAEDAAVAFTFTRELAAPRALVWRAWTEEHELAQWFGPVGFTMKHCRVDARPGGRFHYGMEAPDGTPLWARWVFREVQAPERLVFVLAFSDEGGGLARHGLFAPGFPAEMLHTVTFTDTPGGGTRVVVHAVPVDATPSERQVYGEHHASMRGGWGGTFDQLQAHLAAAATG